MKPEHKIESLANRITNPQPQYKSSATACGLLAIAWAIVGLGEVAKEIFQDKKNIAGEQAR